MEFPKSLERALMLAVEKKSYRNLTSNTHSHIDFFSNDYLNFASNNTIYENTISRLKTSFYKNGSTGARLISGNHSFYDEAEHFLANYYGLESATLFNSGFCANIGFFSCLFNKQDIVFYDEYIHASIREGLRLSFAKSLKFRHNNLEHLEYLIKEREEHSNCYIICESIYSMDGDSPSFLNLHKLCERYNCFLIIDEAHATGLYKKGLTNTLEIPTFAKIITFGKALGSSGAIILGSKKLKEYLINFCKSFIYTTAMTPQNVISIIESHKFLTHSKEPQKLKENIRFFNTQINKLQISTYFSANESPIQTFRLPSVNSLMTIQKALIKNNIQTKVILHPTVPKKKERIRISLHSFNTKDEISHLLKVIKTYTL